MNVSDPPITEVVKHDTTTRTRLRGGRLGAARVVCIGVALLAVGMFVTAVPVAFKAFQTTCLPESCPPGGVALTPDEASGLEQLGISVSFSAWYFTIMMVSVGAVYFCLGALIFWRRSDDLMALFLSLMLVTIGAVFAPTIDPLAAEQAILHWPLALVQTIGFGSLATFLYVFPNGRFVPGWTRWLALATWLMVAVFAASASVFTVFPRFIVIFLVSLAASVAAQTYRYRRVSTPSERQQTKWVLVGFAAFLTLAAIGFIPWMINPALTQPGVAGKLYSMIRVPLFANLPVMLLALGITFSLLRYRLWDIDFIINRSLVYGLMTVLLGGVFVGGFFGLRALLDLLLNRDMTAASATLSAAAIALLFLPTRNRLRALVDRRLYHINVDYRKADTPTPSPVAGGRTLATQMGVFEHLEPIGRGGMAEIYKAHHPTLDKLVAIKILPPTLAKQADFRHRFEREARVVGTLKHPNIVQVYDFGESDGTYYMVLEYVQGQDLGEIIRRDAPLAVERVRDILSQVASALDYAHGQGLVHRDVKPSNVMIETPAFAPSGLRATDQLGHAPTDSPPAGEGQANVGQGEGEQRGRAVLMDFGIARILGGNTYLTATGTVGTFDYIAPEQIQAASNVDGRADVYALGVMAFQMLTGRLPFEAGHPAALLIAHLNQPPPDPRGYRADLTAEVAEAVLRAMAKKPDERFSTAGAFVMVLG